MEINNELRKIYYDLSNPSSFSSIQKLYDEAKKRNIPVTYDKVKEWLSDQLPYSLHKDARVRWKRNKIHVSTLNQQWQADLTFMDEFTSENDGHKYILTVIDCFSKYAYAVALKDKRSGSIISAFKTIFRKAKPISLQTDNGSEFTNNQFKKFMQNENINFFTSNDPVIKCAMIERFNRTLKNKMFKLFTAQGKRRWIHKLKLLIQSYNNSVHSVTKFAPVDVNLQNQHIVYSNIYGNYKPISKSKHKLKSGDHVRTRYLKKSFDKSYFPKWKDEISKVTGAADTPIPTYKIDSDNNKRSHYIHDLQKVNENALNRVEKIIRTRRNNGRTEVYVKWLNYPASHNQWIPLESLQNIMPPAR